MVQVSSSKNINTAMASLSLHQQQATTHQPLTEGMFKSAMNDPAFNEYLKDIHNADIQEIAAQDIQFHPANTSSSFGSIQEIKPGLRVGMLETTDHKAVYFAQEELKTDDDQDR